MRFGQLLILTAALTTLANTAAAGVVYNMVVDTSSISGTSGSIDFQFNPGPDSQSATLAIQTFLTSGTLGGAPSTFGDVTGTLPATLTFDNLSPFNDYFDTFVFGSSLTFTLSFGGDAIDTPNGTSTSGSAFTFSMFSDAAGTVPALTSDPNGYGLTVDLNLDGTTTLNAISPNVTEAVSGVPEPRTLLLTLSAFLIFLATSRLYARRAGKTSSGSVV